MPPSERKVYKVGAYKNDTLMAVYTVHAICGDMALDIAKQKWFRLHQSQAFFRLEEVHQLSPDMAAMFPE